MNRLNRQLIHSLALGVLFIAFSGLQMAKAQYSYTVGTAPGGGNTVVGTSAGSPLPRIVSGQLPLSTTGGDYVTLTIGSLASNDQHGESIKFATPNDTLLNYGTIEGGSGGGNTDSGVAVSFISSDLLIPSRGVPSSDTISGETVINNGSILGLGNNEVFNTDVISVAVSFLATNAIQNVSVTNNVTGNIAGGSNSGDGSGQSDVVDTGLSFYTEESSISNVSVLNYGTISGGSGGFEGSSTGDGVSIYATNGVFNVGIGNYGSISGGSEGDADQTAGTAGNGISIFDLNQDASQINGVGIYNAGNITGGSNNGEGMAIGNGISIWGGNGVFNVGINNTRTGNITGGSFGNSDDFDEFDGTVAGNGISIFDNNNQGIDFGDDFDVNGVTILNAGNITGGNQNSANWLVGNGIGIYGFGNVENILIYNSGLIQGGNFNDTDAQMVGNGIAIGAGGFEDNGSVGNIQIINAPGGTIAGGIGENGELVGAGIAIFSGNSISGVGITNYGNITGGPGGLVLEGDPNGGDGIDIVAPSISNVTIINASMNSVISGGAGSATQGGSGGAGIVFDADFDDDIDEGPSDPSNILVVNYGMIIGGAGYNGGNSGGTGLYFAGQNDSNVVFTNWCGIQGGNGYNGATAGFGVQIGNINNPGEIADHVTLNNWGEISAGSGAVNVAGLPAGFPSVAISVYGNNNVVNLNGHSSVNGTIQGVNSGGNNFLNLNFTGMSPAAIAGLKAQLAAEGYPGSNNFTGTFTVRGVTYYVDPMILGVNVSSYEQVPGLTQAEYAVAVSLDSETTNPNPCSALAGLFNAIDNSGNTQLALDELSPLMYQAYGELSLAQLNFIALEIDHRLNNLRDGSETIDTTGIGGDTTATAGYSKDGKNVEAPATEAPKKHWGFFASGAGVFTDINGTAANGLTDANFKTAELIMGVDGRINDKWMAGLLFNYDYTVATLDSQGSKANVETFCGGVYTGYRNEGWYGNGLATYGHNAYDSDRTIIFPGFNQVAVGHTDGNQYEVNIDGGYDFHINDSLTMGPLAGLQYVNLNVDGFNEAGAGAADLAVGSQNVSSLRSRLGFRADYHKQLRKEVAFAAELRAEWQHEFLDDSYGISSTFIGAALSPFVVQTTSPQRDSAIVGGGINFTIRDTMTLFVDYDVQAGQKDYFEQTIKGGVKFSF